jgi:hypothetical protein
MGACSGGENHDRRSRPRASSWIRCFDNALPIHAGPPYARTPVADGRVAKKPVGQISRELRNPVLARSANGNDALSRGSCDRNVTPRQQRAKDQMEPLT